MAVVKKFNCRLHDFEGGHQFLGGVYMRKTCTGTNFIPGLLFDSVSRLHDDWLISYLTI